MYMMVEIFVLMVFSILQIFEEHEAVRELFKCSTETKQYIQNKYRKFLNKRTVSIQIIRPGDYVPQQATYYWIKLIMIRR